MKLIDLLAYIDHLTLARIYHFDEPDEPVFEGNVMDIPYIWMDCELFRRDEGDWEGIRSYKNENMETGIVIYIKD